MAPIEAMRDGDIRAMSRRHSVASDRNMASVMSRELANASVIGRAKAVGKSARSDTNIPGLRLLGLELNPLLQLAAEFGQFTRVIGAEEYYLAPLKTG